MSATWFSTSKKKAIPLHEMAVPHLLNAYRKFKAGEAYDENGDVLGEQAMDALKDAFETEFARREIDPDGGPAEE